MKITITAGDGTAHEFVLAGDITLSPVTAEAPEPEPAPPAPLPELSAPQVFYADNAVEVSTDMAGELFWAVTAVDAPTAEAIYGGLGDAAGVMNVGEGGAEAEMDLSALDYPGEYGLHFTMTVPGGGLSAVRSLTIIYKGA